MPKPRKQLVDLSVTRYYHVVNRCVRRAFLTGDDDYSGRNFDHRRGWIAERLELLTTVFAVDVCSYAMMSNHFHVVTHVDCERVQGWNDAEVADRYAVLFKKTVDRARKTDQDLWNKRIIAWRQRLGDLSWFMRCLSEHIARRANQEDECTGRFWEGRFKSQALLDVPALAACMTYVDLNPLRAGMADSIEGSDYTSIQQRLIAVATPEERSAEWLAPFLAPIEEGPSAVGASMAMASTEALAAAPGEPFEDEVESEVGPESSDRADTLQRVGVGVEASATAQRKPGEPSETATKSGAIGEITAFESPARKPIPLRFEGYLELLRWTAAKIRRQRGNPNITDIPGEASSVPTAVDVPSPSEVLSGLGLNPDSFLKIFLDFRKRFPTMAGSPEEIDRAANQRKYKRTPGIEDAGDLYESSG